MKRLLLIFVLVIARQAAFAQLPLARIPSASNGYNLYRWKPYRKQVAKPADVLGYEIGERNSNFREQERVLLAVAESAKERVRVIEYGKSVEGRPLRLVIVSAPENLAKLDKIQANNLLLADPRKIASPAEAESLLASAPAITWINHCIHGDETASFEAFMGTFYTLAASEAPEIKAALKNSVVILNPVFNPDGHERFTVYYNSIGLGSPEGFAFEQGQPWAVSGRFNHYRFDMNRDKMVQSQPEVQQEIAAYLKWLPHVYVDEHGQPETYFFPPNPEAIHTGVDVGCLNKWTDIFGRANAAVFDSFGWQHVTKEDFDFFYPGYLDSWATFSGAIGMTYETDGGRTLARRRRDDTISTLWDATVHHIETALATIITAGKRRQELARDFFLYRKSALTPQLMKAVVFPPQDRARLAEAALLLLRSGIEVQIATKPFESQNAHDYATLNSLGMKRSFPAGSLIVDLAQPQGRLAKAFLEPDPKFSPAFLKDQQDRRARNEKRNPNEAHEGYTFYDITAWAVPYSFGLEAHWLEDAPKSAGELLQAKGLEERLAGGAKGGVAGEKTNVAYIIPYDSEAAVVMALRLAQSGYRLAVANKPFQADGKAWARGAFLLRVNRNPADLREKLDALGRSLGVSVFSVKSSYAEETGIGSDSVSVVNAPSIAVVAGENVSQTSYGAVWHLLEKKAGIKFTPIRLDRIAGMDLAAFNVLIFPDGYGYGGVLGKAGADKLRDWVQKGGALIGLEGGAQWLTEKDVAFSEVKAVGEGEGKKPLELPGAFFKAKLDASHFLGYGYLSEDIAVPLQGGTFWKPTKKGSNVIRFGKEKARLSGFAWEGNTEELLAETAYVVAEPTGRGNAILFLNDPTFRAMWVGLHRVFWNAILLGSGTRGAPEAN